MEILSAKNDIIFKKLFTENKELLANFLESMMDLPAGSIKEIIFEDTNVLPFDIDGKQGTLDFKIRVDYSLVNVELQLQKKGDFTNRTLYYWAKIFSGELDSGEDYDKLKPTVAINILNYNLFPETSEPFSTFKLMETTRYEIMTEKCVFHFCELKKIGSSIDKNDRKRLWLQLIKAETEEELDMLEKTGVPEISKAAVTIREMSEDEQLKEIARYREKWAKDEASALAWAKREGRAEGRAEGEESKEKQIIAQMRAAGMNEEEIKRVISIDIEQ